MSGEGLGEYIAAVYVATYAALFGYAAYLLRRLMEVGRED